MEKLQEDLNQYPSSFTLYESVPVKKEIKIMKEKLLLEMEAENEYYTDMEKHRTWNLISFASFLLCDLTEAEEFNEKVLASDSRNMIALSNKARFAIELNKIKQCKDIMEQLKVLSKDKVASLIAKAEIAFTCSRFGIRKYDKAKVLFENVIKECDDNLETKSESEIPVENVCIWLFGYALIQNRQLNVNNTMDENLLNISPDNYKQLAELYCRIIRLKGSSTCLNRYKARSYVDLGLLAYNIQQEHNMTTFPEGISGIFPEDQIKKTVDYFSEALGIFPTDVYVLERSGKYFRYSRDIEESIKLLEEAVRIKGSSYSHHHLALSLHRKLAIATGCIKVKRSDSHDITSTPVQPYGHKTKHLKQPLVKNRHTENNDSVTIYHRNKGYQGTRETESKSTSAVMPGQPIPLHDMLKNPRKPKQIDYEKNKDSVDKIIDYFEKACTVSKNSSAMYDKGLLYRQIGDSEKALEIFTTLLKNKDGHCSRVQVANSYEQAAFCIYDSLRKAEMEGKPRNTDMEYTMKMYLKSSLEISCNIVAKIPYLYKCWKSAPTLKTLLLGEAVTKEGKQDLLFLHRKMKNYKGAIDVLCELETLAESNEEKAEIIQEKIEHLLQLRNYDDAVVALDVIACLPDGSQMVDKGLYQQVNVEAAIDGLRQGYAEIARQRIQNAFGHSNRDNCPPTDSGNEDYDIFILCNPNEDNGSGRKLMDILNQTGLNTTFNTESKLAGISVIAGMRSVMQQSRRFVILLDFDFGGADEDTKNQMQVFADMLSQILQMKMVKSVVLVMTETGADVPEIFFHFPYRRIDMDLCTVDKDFLQNERILEGIKSILLSLVAVR